MTSDAKRAELERLLGIAGEYGPNQQLALLHRFETEEGGKVTERGADRWFTLAGIKARGRITATAALVNWQNAARRALRGADL